MFLPPSRKGLHRVRDLVILAIVASGCLAALRRPWIGILVWTWLSIMNPHRFAYGFSYSAPLAASAAAATLLGLLMTKDRGSPVKGAPVAWTLAFMAWFTLSWLFGLSIEGDYPQWNKVMKVLFMTIVGMSLLRSKQHVLALSWVVVLSLALLGAKGGVFTIATGGGYRVWGPPGSFIADNNEFALALVMTIPLIRFLQLQLVSKVQRNLMTVLMVLCAASAMGSQSRGALLAITAMALLLWWRGKSRMLGGVVILIAATALVAFMPDSWVARMNTIGDYQEDRSALGRISAWWNAFGIAKSYVFGVGFNAARPELFARFSPYPDFVHAAHSIYFQVLGNHGFVGLFLFLGIFISTYRMAGAIRRASNGIPEARWCDDLAAMAQVSLVGYAVGGAFLSLAYFDLPYNVMMLVVLTHVWVKQKAWLMEPVYKPGWWTIPGLASPLALHRKPVPTANKVNRQPLDDR
jgi:putative inorganic carbon (hco3(-)) transporter